MLEIRSHHPTTKHQQQRLHTNSENSEESKAFHKFRITRAQQDQLLRCTETLVLEQCELTYGGAPLVKSFLATDAHNTIIIKQNYPFHDNESKDLLDGISASSTDHHRIELKNGALSLALKQKSVHDFLVAKLCAVFPTGGALEYFSFHVDDFSEDDHKAAHQLLLSAMQQNSAKKTNGSRVTPKALRDSLAKLVKGDEEEKKMFLDGLLKLNEDDFKLKLDGAKCLMTCGKGNGCRNYPHNNAVDE